MQLPSPKVLIAIAAALLTGQTAFADDPPTVPRGPLLTRWATKVKPSNPLPEYPRPQMVRSSWQSLNGQWDYAITARASAKPDQYSGKITVPFPIESILSGVTKRLTPDQSLWYRKRFSVPSAWKGKRLLLHFGAVDWEAKVWINGMEAAQHRGGFDGFSADITDLLKAGEQEIIVRVWDPTEAGIANGKQRLKPEGIWYTPCTGIWQTVWIEPVHESYVRALRITSVGMTGRVVVGTDIPGRQDNLTVGVDIMADGKRITSTRTAAGKPAELMIPDPMLWSPDSPFLYDLAITVSVDGQVVDRVSSYVGIREISLAKDDAGITRTFLNGKPIFMTGPLDQGYWPDGIYTAPTDEALRFDIEQTKRLGFNMTRKHVKVEPERWYTWCDRLGLLVWQDMPSPGGAAGDDPQNGLRPIQRAQFESEMDRLVMGRYNHPSIILWVVFNEGWGQYDTERLTAHVKALDPLRLVNDASGWTDRKVGDVIDMHNYPGPGSPKPEAIRAAVLGEFGGLGLTLSGHTWAKNNWGYRNIENRSKLTTDFVNLWRNAWELHRKSGLSAAVYTQITDVETEVNGLFTYDRAILKVDVDRAAKAIKGLAPPPPLMVPVVISAQHGQPIWKWTTSAPTDGWQRPGLQDASWQQGPAGFGTEGTPGAIVRTVWNTPDIYLRRFVTLKQSDLKGLRLRVHHDEDVEIYLNGVLALKLTGFIGNYDDFEIAPLALKALKQGENLIAVHCHQTGGGQYVDVGMVKEQSSSTGNKRQ